MSGIQLPWPPSDWTAEMPFDQRGCCWPWGPIERRLRLEIRFDLIGYRDDGPVGALWGAIGTGMLLIPHVDECSCINWVGTGGLHIPPKPFDFMEIARHDFDAPWFCQLSLWNNVGPLIFNECRAEGVVPNTVYTTGFELPVNPVHDLTSGPQFVFISPVPWYKPSLYPLVSD